MRARALLKGFTITELLVTVAIICLLAVAGGIAIESRYNAGNLETTAKAVLNDFISARSDAMTLGCPVRLMFCNDALCKQNSVANSNRAGGYVADSGSSTPAQFYAFYKMSNGFDNQKPCYISSAVPAAIDGYSYWDADRKPQKIPDGVAFSGYYNQNGVPNNVDWWDRTSSDAQNSVYFDAKGMAHPSTNGTLQNGAIPLAELTLSSCNPTSNSNCPGYIIGMLPGGAFSLVKCIAGQAISSNGCL